MFDSCICNEDYDTCAEFSRTSLRTARNTYPCCECAENIQPGDRYEYVSGKWDGEFCIIRTCEVCSRIRRSLFSCMFAYRRMWSDIHEHYCRGSQVEGDEEFCICPPVTSEGGK